MSFLLDLLRSHYPKRSSVLDFKDAAALLFGHSDVVLCHEHQKLLLLSHQQLCLINGICATFDIKSNYFV